MKHSAALCIIALGVVNALELKARQTTDVNNVAYRDSAGYRKPPTFVQGGVTYEYIVSGTRENWANARKKCQGYGGDLAKILGPEEQKFITEYPSKPQDQMWIGGGDYETEGVWKWYDGTPVTWFNWYGNQPSFNRSGKSENTEHRDCIFLWRDNQSDGNQWEDAHCGALMAYICKRVYDPKMHVTLGTHVETLPGKTTVVKRTVPNTSGAGSGAAADDDDSIGTQLHIKVAWNSGITDLADTHLNSLDVQGGHHGEEATEEETLLTQVDAETQSVPDGIQKLNLKIPYNLEMAVHGQAALDSLSAAAGLV